MYHILYKTTNLINGMIYIGKHSTSNLNDGYIGSGTELNKAVLEYGISNFVCEPIFFAFSEIDAYQVERDIVNLEFIRRTDTYNKVPGGKGSCFGESNHFYGKTHSPEHIQKIKNRKWSDETKAKIAKGNSKPCDPDKKLKISKTLTGRKIPEFSGVGNPMTKILLLISPLQEEFYITSSEFVNFCKYKILLPYTLMNWKDKEPVPQLNRYSNRSPEKVNSVGWQCKTVGRLKEYPDIKLFSIP